MNKPWDIITALESNNSRLYKEEVVGSEAKANNSEFFNGVGYALNQLVTFGLKQINEKTGTDGPGLDWDSFVDVADCLVARELTGHAARDAVAALIEQATVTQWNNWYRRILIKDLRCGVSEKTINNVVKKKYANYSVPVFSCQLAHDSTNHESKVAGQKLLEVKLDGVRVLTIVYPTGRVDQFSRNGKELLNFEHIKQQFSNVASTLSEPMVFDGEVMSKSFQDLMKQVHRKSNVDAGDATLFLFDMVPLKDFQQGFYKVAQKQRSENLSTWFNTNGLFMQLVNVQLLTQRLVDLDTTEGKAEFKRINQEAITGGYEGIMIKDPAAPYECKRSHAWLKLKPYIEVTLEVVATEEGTGKNVGKLGALVCSGVDDGKTITVNVGSGFSDQDRDDFWNAREEVIGQLVEVRADAITQNQDGSYSLRFPRFKGFRGFVPGEKI